MLERCHWNLVHVVVVALVFILAVTTASSQDLTIRKDKPGCLPVQRRVMVFYYPWYGTADGPGGSGRTIHWGRIDTAAKDIAASTHYPELGPYDSHDPKLIEQHCRWARQAGIDTFIVSWWGHGDYTDRALEPILRACRKHGLTACVYYETIPGPKKTAQVAAADLVKLLEKYGDHPAYLKVHDKPVVFIYGRAFNQLGLVDWAEVLNTVNSTYRRGFLAIADKFSYAAARLFDGLHTYNTAGLLRDRSVEQVRRWAKRTYPGWVELADAAGKISTITVIPGYDDTKVRSPGLAIDRFGSKLYRVQWQAAIEADPHWILVTSFNEWHEGSEIEPSLQFGRTYLELTGRFARQFKAKPRPIRCCQGIGAVAASELARLRQKYQSINIAVLPDPDSTAFWWALEAGLKVTALTWRQVAAGRLRSERFDLLLYCAGETYQPTVDTAGDVDRALLEYLDAGGTLAVLPALPWPFYYDQSGQAVHGSGQFGLTIKMGWEAPPAGVKLKFVQPRRELPHVPASLPFPTGPDTRWRPMFPAGHKSYVPLLQLRDGQGRHLGDAVVYAERAPAGKLFYVWFGLLDVPQAERLLYDCFDYLADKVRADR